MIYQMKQRLFAFGDDFHIKDEAGNNVFFVDGKVFTLGDKLSFQDTQNNELAFIKQRLLAWGPTYEIHRNEKVAAVVKKHLFTFLRYRFSVDVPGPDDLEVEGDFLAHEYTFTRSGRPVAQVSKRWIALGDSYGVNIEPGEDDVLILASTVVIDMVLDDAERKRDND
jgi:uncharacterized protein YxjI